MRKRPCLEPDLCPAGSAGPTPPLAIPAGPPAEALVQAFHRFEHAAASLEERHADLRAKAERLERQLLAAHRRLETVLDAMEGGVAVVAPDGELLRTNRAFEQMGLGRTGERLADDDLKWLGASSTAGGAARIRRDSPSGPRDLAITVLPSGEADTSLVVTVQDITEIRIEEEEEARRRHLEALGRMAAEIAHEVRNPLGSIRLFAGMLRDDLEGNEPLRDMADQIVAATAGVETTVSNLLAFASPCRGQARSTDLAVLASDACSLLAPACALRGVRLTGPVPAAGCAVEADPEGMRQVLLNLLGNALAATEPGGSIEVTARLEKGHAALLVEDSGRGIAPEDLPRVFDPFFTRTEGGTGLGLSIVHRIVERHGGRISLDSAPGRGTRARVEIPAGAGGQAAEGTHV